MGCGIPSARLALPAQHLPTFSCSAMKRCNSNIISALEKNSDRSNNGKDLILTQQHESVPRPSTPSSSTCWTAMCLEESSSLESMNSELISSGNVIHGKRALLQHNGKGGNVVGEGLI